MERSCGYIGIYLFNFIFYFLLPLNLFQVFDSAKILKTYSMAFCCIGLYAIFQIIFSLFGLFDPFALQRVGALARGQAWTYEPSYYALYITAYVMFKNATALLKVNDKLVWKDIAKLLGVNCMLIASTSTGLIFSYPIFCAVTFWLSLLKPLRASLTFVKWRIVKFIAFCCAFCGMLSILFWDIVKWSFFKFFYFGFQNHGSFTIRWDGIVACWKIFLEYPFFGIGIGGVGPYYFIKNAYYDTVPQTLTEVELYDPTNVFTEVLASLGLVGMIGLVMLAWAFYRAFRKVITSSAVSAEEKNTSQALFISLIVLLIVLQFNQGLFRPYIWIHAGVVYGYLNSRKLLPN
jgi:O-antigen ligase